jgi:uncharacterized membrane protein
MNDAHFHLVINHLPIIVPFIGALVLIIGLLFNQEAVKRVAYLLFILGAIVTFPSMSSGEGAEEIVEHLPNMSHNIIHEHEEKAEFFSILSYLLGAISLVAMWISWKRKKLAKLTGGLVLAFSIVVLFFARQTGTTGGEISHPEIREGFKVSTDNEHVESGESEEEDEH